MIADAIVPPRMRVLRPALGRVALILLGASIVLPAITSLEHVTFTVGGVDWNVRVAAYFLIALIAGVAALPIVLGTRRRPLWLLLMIATLLWFTLTAVVARQSPVEWLPTLVRFGLYFSATVVFYEFTRGFRTASEADRFARLVPICVLAGAAIPALAGLAEFVRGSAPLLNGAQRVAGSMPTHPVAFSLVLVVAGIATVGPALVRGRDPRALVRWVAVGLLLLIVFMTFTRLSILLLVVAAAAIAILVPADRRTRAARFGMVVLVGGSVMVLAQPAFEARFTYPTTISRILASPGPAGSTDVPTTSPGDAIDDIEVDASVAYRIMLTQKGLQYFTESPLVGQGPGSFHRLFEADSGRANVAAHNDILSLAVETGLPGLGLYLATLASLAWALWPRRSMGDLDADALVVVALVALGAVNLGAAIHNPTYFVEVQLPIWILVGTALGLRDRQRRTADQGASELRA